MERVLQKEHAHIIQESKSWKDDEMDDVVAESAVCLKKGGEHNIYLH